MQREFVEIRQKENIEAFEQVILDEPLRFWPRGDLPLFLLLWEEAVFVKPSKRYGDRRGSDIARLADDQIAQFLFGATFVHLGLEAEQNVTEAAFLRAVRLLLVNVEVPAPFPDALPDDYETALLISVAAHMPSERQNRFYREVITWGHDALRGFE